MENSLQLLEPSDHMISAKTKLLEHEPDVIIEQKGKSRPKSTKNSENRKKKPTKFKFPKSKSSQSGQYSGVKSRYLDVFKSKTTSGISETPKDPKKDTVK